MAWSSCCHVHATMSGISGCALASNGCGSDIRVRGSDTRGMLPPHTSFSVPCARRASFRAACASRYRCPWSTASGCGHSGDDPQRGPGYSMGLRMGSFGGPWDGQRHPCRVRNRDACDTDRKVVREYSRYRATGFPLFGTFGGWPAFAPADLGRTVELINAAVASTGRRVDWVHIPTLDTLNEAFYAPLENLDVKGARIYLGAIHNMATLKARLDIARVFLPDFGLAAYCGFGRTPSAELPRILRDHLAALRIAGLART